VVVVLPVALAPGEGLSIFEYHLNTYVFLGNNNNIINALLTPSCSLSIIAIDDEDFRLPLPLADDRFVGLAPFVPLLDAAAASLLSLPPPLSLLV
jgi:hypothetical protein